MPTNQTREQIIRAAESLFARHGFARASLRQVTQLAEVNLASVNYHFGSKEKLIQHVFRRHLDVLNQGRERAYEELHQAGHQPTLSELLRAFIAPALELSTDPERGHVFVQIVARGFVEYRDELREFLSREYGEINRRFIIAIAAHLKDLSHDEVTRRIDFTIGALTYSMGDFGLAKFPAGGDRQRYLDETVASLVAYAEAGLTTAHESAIALRSASVATSA